MESLHFLWITFDLKNPKPLRKFRIFGENRVQICFRTDLDTNFVWLFWQFFKAVYGLPMNIIWIISKFELKNLKVMKISYEETSASGESRPQRRLFLPIFGFRVVKDFQYLLPCFVIVNLSIHKYDIFHPIPDFHVQSHVYLVTEMVLRFLFYTRSSVKIQSNTILSNQVKYIQTIVDVF